MAEITQAGYASIRKYIEENWNTIELLDDAGKQILKLNTSDPRVEFTHAPGAATLELSVVVKGNDPGMTLPKKFASSVVHNAQGPVTAVESFSNFEMTMAEDQLTVRHRIEVPQQA